MARVTKPLWLRKRRQQSRSQFLVRLWLEELEAAAPC